MTDEDIKYRQGRSRSRVETTEKIAGISTVITGLILIILFLLNGCKTPDKVVPKDCCDKYESYLDKNPWIMHWEIINDSIHIYTKSDSIIDERARWRYHDSIYNAEGL